MPFTCYLSKIQNKKLKEKKTQFLSKMEMMASLNPWQREYACEISSLMCLSFFQEIIRVK